MNGTESRVMLPWYSSIVPWYARACVYTMLNCRGGGGGGLFSAPAAGLAPDVCALLPGTTGCSCRAGRRSGQLKGSLRL